MEFGEDKELSISVLHICIDVGEAARLYLKILRDGDRG